MFATLSFDEMTPRSSGVFWQGISQTQDLIAIFAREENLPSAPDDTLKVQVELLGGASPRERDGGLDFPLQRAPLLVEPGDIAADLLALLGRHEASVVSFRCDREAARLRRTPSNSRPALPSRCRLGASAY